MKLTTILQEMEKPPRYSAVLLDDRSHQKLIDTYKKIIPVGWTLYAHHMTIDPFKLIDNSVVGTTVSLKVTDIGISDKAIAVKVSGYNGKTNNAFPHITIAINPLTGKPKDSNSISSWGKEDKNIELHGSIRNL